MLVWLGELNCRLRVHWQTPLCLVLHHNDSGHKQPPGCELFCELQGQGMRDADMLVWAGDFNYRVEASYEDALEHVAHNDLDWLLERVKSCTAWPL